MHVPEGGAASVLQLLRAGDAAALVVVVVRLHDLYVLVGLDVL